MSDKDKNTKQDGNDTIHSVSTRILCAEKEFFNTAITTGRMYNFIEEHEHYYRITDDEGNETLQNKRFFIKMK